MHVSVAVLSEGQACVIGQKPSSSHFCVYTVRAAGQTEITTTCGSAGSCSRMRAKRKKEEKGCGIGEELSRGR